MLCTADARSIRTADGPLLGLAADLVLKPFDLVDLLGAVACGIQATSAVPSLVMPTALPLAFDHSEA